MGYQIRQRNQKKLEADLVELFLSMPTPADTDELNRQVEKAIELLRRTPGTVGRLVVPGAPERVVEFTLVWVYYDISEPDKAVWLIKYGRPKRGKGIGSHRSHPPHEG